MPRSVVRLSAGRLNFSRSDQVQKPTRCTAFGLNQLQFLHVWLELVASAANSLGFGKEHSE